MNGKRFKEGSGSMTPVFQLTKRRGSLIILNEDLRREYIRGLPEGNYIEIIKRPDQVKSRREECYMWSVVIPLWEKHQGYTRREAYLDLLAECGPRDGGLIITTSDDRFTRQEYHRWVEDSLDYIAREGCVTPDPGEVAI